MQGDHEELKILLKNCLIASRFNQELREEERVHRFLMKNSREKCRQSDSVKADQRLRSCDDRGPWSHVPRLSHFSSV